MASLLSSPTEARLFELFDGFWAIMVPKKNLYFLPLRANFWYLYSKDCLRRFVWHHYLISHG